MRSVSRSASALCVTLAIAWSVKEFPGQLLVYNVYNFDNFAYKTTHRVPHNPWSYTFACLAEPRGLAIARDSPMQDYNRTSLGQGSLSP
eukprot:s1513_g25.t1